MPLGGLTSEKRSDSRGKVTNGSEKWSSSNEGSRAGVLTKKSSMTSKKTRDSPVHVDRSSRLVARSGVGSSNNGNNSSNSRIPLALDDGNSLTDPFNKPQTAKNSGKSNPF